MTLENSKLETENTREKKIEERMAEIERVKEAGEKEPIRRFRSWTQMGRTKAADNRQEDKKAGRQEGLLFGAGIIMQEQLPW